jgi:hypothetical protein
MVLSAPGEARGTLETALRSGGYAGQAWDGRVTVSMMPGDAEGLVMSGAGEFEGLAGSYTESWTLASVDENGELSGTIELSTVTSRPQ